MIQPPTGFTIYALAAAGLQLALTIFWIVVAWRGMRALQGIETCLRERPPR